MANDGDAGRRSRRADPFERILLSLHDAMLDDAGWPSTSRLIDEACGLKGNILAVGEGSPDDVRIVFAVNYHRGEQREDLAREYLENYHPWDEQVPRLRKLPDSLLVSVKDLYTERELKTSRTYNEMFRRAGGQNGLYVRLDLAPAAHITWALNDPVQASGWASGQLEMIERLVPHIRQYVQVRQTVAGAQALGASLGDLLDNTRVGVIQLDRRGRIVETNHRARVVLRRGDGLFDAKDFLRARLPADDARLGKLLGAALPNFGGAATSGSLTVRRAPGMPALAVHISPVSSGATHVGLQRVAALVLVVDPGSRPRIDVGLVAEALGLKPAESRVASLLAEGRTVRDIAAATGRKENTVRWMLNRIYDKQGISRQADLVRLVLSLAELSAPAP